jgi:alpha-glucosidase (family GH31 glycosyl hydrolase)
MAGRQWLTVNAPLGKIPVFVRSGTILPLGPVVQHTNEFDVEEFTLYLYLAENGEASYQLHEEEQVRSMGASVEGNKLDIHSDPMPHRLDYKIFGKFHDLETKVINQKKKKE